MPKPAGFSRRDIIGAAAAAASLRSVPAFATAARPRLLVQGRPQDTGSQYKLGNIMSALDQLGGVRSMRCRDPYSGTMGWNTYVGLARAGVKFSFTLSVRAISVTIADLRAFLAVVPGSIWAIEYPNEPDLNPVTFNGVTDPRLGFRTGNAPALMAYITAMRRAIKADPLLRNIPIICSNDYMQAEQGSLSSYGNSHIYPREASDIGQALATFRSKVAAGRHTQGVITEWGRTTGGDASNPTAPPVSLSRQAELIASDLRAIHAEPKVAAVSLYELFSWPGSGEQNNFGLFEADLRPRPVVAAIRSLGLFL